MGHRRSASSLSLASSVVMPVGRRFGFGNANRSASVLSLASKTSSPNGSQGIHAFKQGTSSFTNLASIMEAKKKTKQVQLSHLRHQRFLMCGLPKAPENIQAFGAVPAVTAIHFNNTKLH
mmetsp:Transcript_130358/g.253883  ORF Transcript_130358/g.253883 Transcript_130358/m.253883 type:complete len:120 (+) Transcript_130358:644-1003(+)